MTPLAGRHALALLVLVAVACVPVVLNVYGHRREDRCADPAALRDVARIGSSRPLPSPEHDREWLEQWSMGTVSAGGDGIPPHEFQILRTFEPVHFSTRPVPFFRKGFVTDRHHVEWIETDAGRLPIHWAIDYAMRMPRFMAYLYVYDGEPVENPFASQLEQAFAQIVAGSRPLTVFLIGGFAYDGIGGDGQRRAADWLRDAWIHYRKVCSLPLASLPATLASR